MSDQAATIGGAPTGRLVSGLGGAGLCLISGLIALGLLFHTEAEAAVRTWIESTAYNHCFLVIPIAIWLIWDRRETLPGIAAVPVPLISLLILPLAGAWLVAERLGIMEGRQLIALTMVEVLFLATLGWRLWRALTGPLLYLYFLVPFGEFLTPKLQDVTAWFTRHGLDLLGIPAYVDGYIIEIPEGTFFIAEACAGLRFLIASIAFGALYALMMYRSPVRRTVFIVLSIIMPIVANGIRALGIVVLGHALGSAEAGAADHIIYGWVFFSFVILLLILAGLPFREDHWPGPADAARIAPLPGTPRPGMASGVFAALGAVVLAAPGPLFAARLTQAAVAPPAAALHVLDLAPACLDTGATIAPAPGTIGRSLVQQANCGGILLNIQLEVFSPRSTAGPINAERRRLTHPVGAEDTSEASIDPGPRGGGHAWRVAISTEPDRVTAAATWIDGAPMAPGLAMRLNMAWASVFGAAYAPVLVTIEPVADWTRVGGREKKQMADRIGLFLRETPSFNEQIHTLAQRAVLR